MEEVSAFGSRLSFLQEFNLRFSIETANNKPQSLDQRKQIYKEIFSELYLKLKERIAEDLLMNTLATTVNAVHANWMDAWLSFTWDFVRSEETELMSGVVQAAHQKLPYLKKVLPERLKKQRQLNTLLEKDKPQAVRMAPDERSYYINLVEDLGKEIREMEQELVVLKEVSQLQFNQKIDEKRLSDVFTIIARGGYGRRELTFSSDLDLAYCLDTTDATAIEIQTVQEMVKRMEELFQESPLEMASQYFELEEDLTRFKRQDMLHTIPSILESRVIWGNEQVLGKLKQAFLEICPTEKMVRYLKQQMDELQNEGNEIFKIKEGYGGIRHFQYVVWMLLVVDNYENSNSEQVLEYLKEREWISENQRQNMILALEFYFDLRNMIGLYDHLTDRLVKVGVESPEKNRPERDFFSDTAAMVYLKLKDRFVTIDYMDRFRLHSINAVSTFSRTIANVLLDQTVTKTLPGFTLYKHLGANQIMRFQSSDKKPRIGWNLSTLVEEKRKTRKMLENQTLSELFMLPSNLFDLFGYIGDSGVQLSVELIDGFSSIVPELYRTVHLNKVKGVREFLFNLFVAENGSVAIQQMMDIAAPLNRGGQLKTLLGLFVPEVNQMRYLLRNLETHEYPLCVHSLKALTQVEKEIEKIQKKEPELWRYISDQDIFALKWSTLFHDVGKINPYRDHEKLGPLMAVEMLQRIGWTEKDGVFDLVRLLVANHQSVVRFSQLSAYLDMGILKFFELAERDPRKVVMLYLVNLSDFKSVNSDLNRKAGHIENFFEKTLNILGEFKQKKLSDSLTEAVNQYLNQKVKEIRTSVLLELLLIQCCNRNLEDVILLPLQKLASKEADQLTKHREVLESSLGYLKLRELDPASLERHRLQFMQLVNQAISEENLLSLVGPLSVSWNWFFNVIPNRYLLGASTRVLTSQIQDFERKMSRPIGLSFVKGEKGEHDSILFHFIGSVLVQAKIAYALSWQGINIENGKINKVLYGDGREGFVGYFKVSAREKGKKLNTIQLEDVVRNLVIPPLKPPKVSATQKLSKVMVDYYLEQEKGYLVQELPNEQFKRVQRQYLAIRISLFDAPFVYYKILRSFEAAGITPQQVTITTIGNQIIDYFYISKKDQEKIENNTFNGVLQKYINAEISIS